ncbi:hypothetical protein BKA61DRAFT_595271 [Leptodontidium sp. MPI-SDFR-AT-0119]|nr:hypothetical protein BKA61DRAFT_595271 [Leptodontidium sp. MPI-SDFR-AT-0119]
MIDPVTAIGLVSGILSFVGAAEKILKLSWMLYNSVEGCSEETQIRLELADSMNSISNRIVRTHQPPLSDEDRTLLTLAQECDKLTNDLKNVLQTLKPKRRKSKAQSSLAALKTLVLEPKIKDLEKQLQRCRDQLHFHIAALSRENLKTLLAISKEDGVKMTQLELSITQVRQTMKDMTTMKVDCISDQALTQLKDLLRDGQDTLNEFAQDRILRGIKAGFEDMSYRYQDINSPFQDTLEWVLDLNGESVEATKFTQWLSSGDGIFHICGKLGSGKSTLMKKLCRYKKTKAELIKWMQVKGGRKLIIADFFFYALGSDPRQKSLMGLYRTLLHQILTSSPDLMQNLLPDQWTKALSLPNLHTALEIPDDDIKQAFKRLSTEHEDNSFDGCCFSFFIDGLDEYQATTSVDRREMVGALMDLANSSSGSFKICVSSRMENPFMDMFSEDTRFYLHELTKSDMKKYVQGSLQSVGTQLERRQLALSITKKAEGVFLWVVLVVQKIRKLSDDGVKFSGLIGEVESLPIELDQLFQRILDTLGSEDRRLVGHTASLLQYLGMTPAAKSMQLWLNLGDFYFLEDYVADPRFAEDAQFPHPETETVRESEVRARRRLRGACRGLLEPDKAGDINFIHRSVGDFLKQDKVRVELCEKSFNDVVALSQLKLASMKHYWWDVDRKNGSKDDKGREIEGKTLSRHSILAACLVEQRRKQQLDAPPFVFLTSLDTIPQLSVSTMIDHALTYNKTAFHIHLSQQDYAEGTPYCYYEICHTSRIRHHSTYAKPGGKYWNEFKDEQFDRSDSAVQWRWADEDVDEIEEYSIPVISPTFSELCSGRLEYPLWRIAHIHEMPLESDKLIMLVYCAIGAGIGRVIWEPWPTVAGDEGSSDVALKAAGLLFLRHLFERKIASPNSLTYLAFGSEFGFIRIAARSQQLSIWQHFLCWWVTAAAASGDFISEKETSFDDVPLNNFRKPTSDFESKRYSAAENEPFNSTDEQYVTRFLLEAFIRNGADLQLALKIEDSGEVPHCSDDTWYSYDLEIVPDGGETLVLDVVLNILSRMEVGSYPYGVPTQRIWEVWHERASEALPNSPISVRDWIDRSRLPNKDVLLKLIDEKLEVTERDGSGSDLIQDGSGDRYGKLLEDA